MAKLSLDDRLNQIEDKISEKSFRENKGLGNEVGYYIFDYDPREELYVRNHIACLIVVSIMDLKHLFTCIDMMLTQSAELEQIIFIGHRSM